MPSSQAIKVPEGISLENAAAAMIQVRSFKQPRGGRKEGSSVQQQQCRPCPPCCVPLCSAGRGALPACRIPGGSPTTPHITCSQQPTCTRNLASHRA